MSLVGALKNSPLVRWVFQNLFLTGDNVRLVAQQPVIRGFLPPSAECALDAGAGSGEYTRRLLLPRARQVVALDISEASLHRLRSRLKAPEAERCRLAAASLDCLPCGDGRFDLVLCSEVLEHCEDDRAVLRELARVLRPGGTLVIAVPVPPPPYVDDAHVRDGYTAEALCELLEQAGFEVQEHRYCMFRWSRAALRLRIWAGKRMRLPLPLMGTVHLERWLLGGRGAEALPFDVVVKATKA
jgi:ubiquinone/menaquinone biosynthesis C-methylase UbiE